MSSVQKIMVEALTSAETHAADVAERERLYRLERMGDIVEALATRFEEWDRGFVDGLGIACVRRDRSLVLKKAGWAFVVAPHDGYSLAVNGNSVRVDRRFPMLADGLYDDLKGRISRWAEAIDDGSAREVAR